jgi:hypothetical protein
MTLRSVFLMTALAFLLTLSAAAEDISATLEIDYDGDGMADVTTEETMAEGSTAYDLLDAAADVEAETMDWGIFVIGINGVVANWDEKGTWWSFEVNGEMSDVGVGGYVLGDGDVVTMSFEGAEEGVMTIVLEIDYEGDGSSPRSDGRSRPSDDGRAIFSVTWSPMHLMNRSRLATWAGTSWALLQLMATPTT